MEFYTQSKILSALRGSQNAQAPKSLDIQSCLSNIPSFLREIEEARRSRQKTYIIDENFVNSIKVLIEDVPGKKQSENKKQWLGFLLIAKTFDASISHIEETLFAKNINILLNTISNVVNKNDVLSDIAVVALRAWKALTQMMSANYDQKSHAAALLVLKNICQNVIRKIEKSILAAKQSGIKPEAQLFLKNNQTTQLKIVIESLLTCLELFPGSFKQIIGGNRNNGQRKKDTVTHLFEDLVKIFMLHVQPIAELSLQFLAKMFKARDKTKVNYREWLNRCLTNLILYLDAISPRLFSSTDLNKPLPVDGQCFEFIFDRESSENRESLQNLTIKDMRDQIKDFSQVQNKIDFLFKTIQYTLGLQLKSQNLAVQQIKSMGLEVNVQEIIFSFESILRKQTQQQNFDETQQVCGLSPKDYYKAINFAKYKTIQVLPTVFKQLGQANCLSFVVNTLPGVLKDMVNESAMDHTGGNSNIARNFDKVIQLFEFADSLISNFGLNARKSVQRIILADLDHFNASTLLIQLFKMIIIQRDQTVINLNQSNQPSLKIGKVFQKTAVSQNQAGALNQLSQNFSAHYLEASCLQPILGVLESLTSSKLYLYLPQSDRLKLQQTVFFNILAISPLKCAQSIDQNKTMVALVNIASNMIRNTNQSDLAVQNDLVDSLISYKSKVMQFEQNLELRQHLSYVVDIQLNSIIAPRKSEKFQINSSSLNHISLQQKGLFLESNRQTVKTYLQSQNEAQQQARPQQNQNMESESDEESQEEAEQEIVPAQNIQLKEDKIEKVDLEQVAPGINQAAPIVSDTKLNMVSKKDEKNENAPLPKEQDQWSNDDDSENAKEQILMPDICDDSDE